MRSYYVYACVYAIIIAKLVELSSKPTPFAGLAEYDDSESASHSHSLPQSVESVCSSSSSLSLALFELHSYALTRSLCVRVPPVCLFVCVALVWLSFLLLFLFRSVFVVLALYQSLRSSLSRLSAASFKLRFRYNQQNIT